MASGWAPGQTEGWRPVHQPCWRGPSRLSSPRRFTRHCCSSVVRLPTRLRSARAWASFAFLAVTAPWLCKSPCCTEATPVGPSRPRPGGAMESSYVRVGEQRNAGGRVPGGKSVFWLAFPSPTAQRVVTSQQRLGGRAWSRQSRHSVVLPTSSARRPVAGQSLANAVCRPRAAPPGV